MSQSSTLDVATATEERISSTLTLNSTLRDLRTIDFQIDESQTGEKLFQAFQQDALLAGAILTQQANTPFPVKE